LQNDGVFAEEPDDCYEDALSVEFPNACINLSQSAMNGTNGSDGQGQGQLAQTIDQEAKTDELGAVQQQGAGPFEGGADGHVHQLIGSLGTGTSQNQANQTEILKLWAPPDPDPDDLIDEAPEQEQFGGASCCGFGTQLGGVGNSEEINQQKTLEALGGGTGTLQIATLVSTSSTPTGTCQHNHNAQTKSDTNSDQSSRSASAGGEDGCPGLALITVCENGEGGVGDCQETEVCVGGSPFIDVSEGIFVSCGESSFLSVPVPFIGNLSSLGP
jgi:hypothetical protein